MHARVPPAPAVPGLRPCFRGASASGIGSIALDDCEIGERAIVAAGTVVPPGTILPAGKRALNVPARIARGVSDEERAYIRFAVETYLCLCPRRTDS